VGGIDNVIRLGILRLDPLASIHPECEELRFAALELEERSVDGAAEHNRGNQCIHRGRGCRSLDFQSRIAQAVITLICDGRSSDEWLRHRKESSWFCQW
jgi:hypothetical protein